MAPRRPKNAPRPMDKTLDEFGEMLDRRAGESLGFADLVRRYRRAADARNALKKSEARESALMIADRLYAAGTVISEQRGERLIKVTVKPHFAVTVRAPRIRETLGEAVYEASRVEQRRLAMKGPDQEFTLPRLRGGSLDDVMAALHDMRSFNGSLGRQESEAREALNRIIDLHAGPWRGEPWLTADGWQVGWSTQRIFQASRFKALCEEYGKTYDDYTEAVERAGSSYFKVVPLKPSDYLGEGAVDLSDEAWQAV
ncbi:hypothetical protein KAMIYU_67 [Mycobacterium phage Kamiyu]|uniref:Uncharacterized protein n=2 Tax=Pipefishvirus TaxID=1982899 RepID=A0A2P1CD00_9CAUD|nr:hypothetical protein PHAEDRUS_62 [Mycobacterium phage Phaedrus]YP_002564165.1 gp67 [Mycobacterium phage Phlyer]YP_009011299.1 hypothetical protein CM02_gp068 [Mycobacterium phage Gadjet]AER50198.1 hypothetical protein KAMIYU_67 [Mycobacterium phage Kamiyu]AJD82656.2 hypothetical protein CHANDLER_67 [Mycobacterium phage Chandler]AVJ49071.1 hypothetical protein PBI_BALOO_66 [Mycobacterium phage Baloo]QFG13830.1 hypothetical protein PHILLY_66 [Mycobacterium phage Philly]QGH76003.1 hypothetic